MVKTETFGVRYSSLPFVEKYTNLSYLGKMLFLFLAYFLVAKVGLMLNPVSGFASVVWLPTGIAIAILFLYGRKLWPAVFAGAFLVNLIVAGAPIIVALLIAAGNTLEAIIASDLLRKFNFRTTLERRKDVFMLPAVAVVGSLISASIGVVALFLGHDFTASSIWITWITWLLGDILGGFMAGSLIFTWFSKNIFDTSRVNYSTFGHKKIEATILSLTLLIVGMLIFWDTVHLDIAQFAFIPLIFFPLIWSATRFGPRGATFSNLAISWIAIWGTFFGMGPFAYENAQRSLLFLQLFMGTSALTMMMLASIVTESVLAEEKVRLINHAKDEFLATLAHELRNPLAPIQSSLDLIGNENKLTKKEFMQSVDVINRQIKHMTHLLDDLLDISRITRGKITLRKEIVDVRNVINQAIETTHPLMEKNKHNLHVDIPSKPVWLETDPLRLEQVIVNLLNNAAIYMKSSGQVGLTCISNSDSVIIKVKDSGRGISRELISQIFDTSNTLIRSIDTKNPGGLGIGLKLVKTLVELHSGTILANSEGPGKGSEFIVTFPARRKSDKYAESRMVSPKSIFVNKPLLSNSKHKILVVDDNEDAALSMKKLLQKMGHEAMAIYDGLKVLKVISSYQPDIILLDIGMPGRNGHDIARDIRKQNRDITLVAVTGYGQEEDKRRSVEAGFNFHITKPIGVEELKSLLN